MMQIRTRANPSLSDDGVVKECMDRLMAEYPQITGYQYERVGDEFINILMWGDLKVV